MSHHVISSNIGDMANAAHKFLRFHAMLNVLSDIQTTFGRRTTWNIAIIALKIFT